jgi:FMN phosphatase YigB (HAD superfamily)
VLPGLDSLKGQGLKLGVISNIRRDLLAQLEPSGLFSRLDVVTISQEVGIQKPAPGIFHAALERAGVRPGEALYVGDQYQTDALGARAVGLHAALLDRRGAYVHVTDCSRTSDMAGLVALVRDGAFAAGTG